MFGSRWSFGVIQVQPCASVRAVPVPLLCSRQKPGIEWAEVGGGWKRGQLWVKGHGYTWVEGMLQSN